MININVFSEEKAWSKQLKKKELFFNKICKAFPKKYKFLNKKISLTVLLSNNKKIKELNKQFRNKNKSTDILSFPAHKKQKLLNKIYKENEIYLGDVIINLDKIKSKNNPIKFKEEFNKLWIHGLVHLFGHKHKTDKDFYIMNKIEKKFLQFINKC
jgi:probable rRNA maturation factor